ncbi:MAG: sigma-70 family RNA polymerase sigma factor [Lentisphaeraceae bacterium]|nr:sigma-70 family RNA polymerase sigma factor [Lentisphaeraceae bacterium]
MAKDIKIDKDIERFGELISEHQASVRACIRVMGIPEGYVDDVAQETFITAYKKQSEFDSSRSMRSWLLGIARNLVMNERRKKARRFRILNDHLTDLMIVHAVPVAEELQSTEKLDAVKDCIDNLPERNREVINKKYEQGKTAALIAQEMQKDSSTVRHLIARIVTGLRKCVDGKLEEVGI